jgi:hypothetical protein
MKLPGLSATPSQHPDCCASLSIKLLNSIVACLPRPDASVLSIGCGTGLLEALLLDWCPQLQVKGIEVASCPVRYLPPRVVRRVGGTWETCSLAATANVWLFVYPRTPSLVTSYLNTYINALVEVIIWIGPTADWEDYHPIFSDSRLCSCSKVDDSGLASYETLVVITRRDRKPPLSPSRTEARDMSIDDL